MRLIQLYPTGEVPGTALSSVDVVFVHGLNNRSVDDQDGTETWTAEDGTLWPRDLLPHYMPEARVLCYQYNGSIRGTTNVAGTRVHATALLRHLEDHRNTVEVSRPVIFVGHSLGGVIIKQALILAICDRRYKPLAAATTGIVFFATPHHAGKDLVAGILRAVGNHNPRPGLRDRVSGAFQTVIKPSNRMIQEIEHNNSNLTHITIDFIKVLDQFRLLIGIDNFIEANETQGLAAVVVSEADGYLEGASQQFLAGDHIEICKFSDDARGHDQFRSVWMALKKLSDAVPKRKEHLMLGQGSPAQTVLLTTLCEDNFHEYSRNICPTKGTCRWIEQRIAFQEHRKLWIDGKPAAGKTYLAKHIINKMRSAACSQVLGCFLSGRLAERNSCEAILRSTMHQLGKTHSTLLTSLIDQSGGVQIHGDKVEWTREKLVILWPRFLAQALGMGGKIDVVLDGFDEIPHQDQEDFLDCLQQGEGNVSDQVRQNLRIVILARTCASLQQQSRGFFRYEITERDVERDIRCTVKEELKLFSQLADYSEEFQQTLCDAVTRGAKGIYLWATVMMEDIRIWMPGEDQLQRRLQQLPQSLAELYDSILGRIKARGSNYAANTRRVLRWVVFCLEPLKLQELNVGIAVAELWEKDPSRGIDEASIHSSIIRPRLFGAALIGLCGQLLRLSSNNHVEPVHRTLSQYLTEKPQTIRRAHRNWVVPNHEHFHMPEDQSHAALGSMCAAYLTMPSFRSSGEPFRATGEGPARWESKIQKRIRNHDLAQYSALCWTKHLSLAGSVSGEDDQTRRNCASLRNARTGFAISWFEVWWFVRQSRDLNFPGDGVDLETFLAEDVSSTLIPHRGAQNAAKLGGVGISEHQLQSAETLVEAGERGEKQVGAERPPQPPSHRTPMPQRGPEQSRNPSSGSSRNPRMSRREREASDNPLHHEQRFIQTHNYMEHRNHTTINIDNRSTIIVSPPPYDPSSAHGQQPPVQHPPASPRSLEGHSGINPVDDSNTPRVEDSSTSSQRITEPKTARKKNRWEEFMSCLTCGCC